MVKQPSPWLAFFLSFPVPGTGHFYCNQFKKALCFLLLSIVFNLCGASTIVLFNRPLAFSLFATCGSIFWFVRVFAGISAFIEAKRSRNQAQERPFPGWAIVVGSYFILTFLGVLIDTLRIHYVAESFQNPTSSMVPTLLPGDRFEVDKIFIRNENHPISRGTIVIYHSPTGVIHIKRVIGLPEDTIEGRGTQILVNGNNLTLSPEKLEDGDSDYVETFERGTSANYRVKWNRNAVHVPFSITVPSNHVFLMGDNRDNSQDSRNYGPVAKKDLIGTAKFIWFSFSRKDGLRWARIGSYL